MKSRQFKIVVTPEDIHRGEPGKAASCPIALAIRRAVADCESIHVDGDSAFVDLGKEYFDVDLPEECNEFVGAFDRGERVEPFSFSIALEAT